MNDRTSIPVNQIQIENDEITLKELILKTKEYALEILRNWLTLLMFIIPIAAYLVYGAYKSKKTYNADLTFILNDEGSSSLGLSAALGSLGDFAGGGSKSKFDKVIELSKSRKILQMALFRKGNINGVDDYYANHLIKERELHKIWDTDTTGLKTFLFRRGSIDEFTRTENNALLILQNILVGKNAIFKGTFDKKSDIMKLSLNTYNEELSIKLLKVIYEELSIYYIEKSVSKEQKTYQIFKSKADSLRSLALSKDRSADQYEDNHRGSLFLEDKREAERFKKDALLYGTLYGETQKNLNLASFALEAKIPYIQEIDMPIAPITPVKKSKLLALIIGFILGSLLGTIVVVSRKVLRETLA